LGFWNLKQGVLYEHPCTIKPHCIIHKLWDKKGSCQEGNFNPNPDLYRATLIKAMAVIPARTQKMDGILFSFPYSLKYNIFFDYF